MGVFRALPVLGAMALVGWHHGGDRERLERRVLAFHGLVADGDQYFAQSGLAPQPVGDFEVAGALIWPGNRRLGVEIAHIVGHAFKANAQRLAWNRWFRAFRIDKNVGDQPGDFIGDCCVAQIVGQFL